MALPLDIVVIAYIAVIFGASLVAPFLHRLAGDATGWVLALAPLGVGYGLLGFLPQVAAGEIIRTSVPWIPALGIELSFMIDGLSLTFAVLIVGIGAAILVYSAAYMHGHPNHGRFLSYLLLFMGAMLGLVLADDMIALYCFWELTTVASFLLIGFDHARQAARRAALQALVITAAGGLALLVAAILLRLTSGSFSISTLSSITETGLYPAVLVFVFLAAFTKSAQVPFHFWLPNAMEAPTPVSAFLHSATMVQGGVYLLLRLHPTLGGSTAWTLTLTVFGGVTLLWGSLAAFRQTDLKQMLAQTTVASLGLLVVLIGVGTETAIFAAIIYFVAHAFYKATLFLVVGLIDHETGVRDITALGGLRERMAVTFIAAVFAGISMVGLPPAMGFYAKEEMFLLMHSGQWADYVVLAVLFVGNAALGAVAIALMVKPFMGAPVTLPKAPREGPFGMLLAPTLLAAAGLVAGWQVTWFALSVASPAVSAVTGTSVSHGIVFSLDPTNPVIWLSIATWVAAYLLYRRLDGLRALARRAGTAAGWSFDQAFDVVMFGLIRFSAAVTRWLHHGRLEVYLVVVFSVLLVTLTVPFWVAGGLPSLPEMPSLTFYEWGVALFAVAGISAVVLARTRLFAIVALGVQGLAVALLFMLFGAPDLSFTQFMVEILSVVILALVMTKLNLDTGDSRKLADLLRDGVLAVLCGAAVTVLLLAVVRGPFDPRLSEFFAAASYPLAHGRNIVNVILVDFRALDTLGEIAVVMAAGVAVLALLRRPATGPAPAASPPPRPRRKRRTKREPELPGLGSAPETPAP